MTFDRAYIRKEHYMRAAADIRRWLEEYPPITGRANHWPTIAEFYERNPDVAMIGIWQTSVSDCPFEGEWNEVEDTRGLVDWSLTFEVYDELDAIKEAAP
jgi:hypothetical protein